MPFANGVRIQKILVKKIMYDLFDFKDLNPGYSIHFLKSDKQLTCMKL